MKLTSILTEGRRTTPAIITMKRGTVIKADHARFVMYPGGEKILVAGIGPPLEHLADARPAASGGGLVRLLRDFWRPGQYVPTDWQDETGWHEPGVTDTNSSMTASGPMWDPINETDGYSAHRRWRQTSNFTKIMTMNPNNIESIDWI